MVLLTVHRIGARLTSAVLVSSDIAPALRIRVILAFAKVSSTALRREADAAGRPSRRRRIAAWIASEKGRSYLERFLRIR